MVQVLVDGEGFALVEHRSMGGVQLIGAEHAARGRDVQRHSTGQEART